MIKKTTLDDLIVWYSKPISYDFFKVGIVYLILVLIFQFFLDVEKHYYPAMLIGHVCISLAMFFALLKEGKWFYKNNRMRDILEIKMFDVPYSLREKAWDLYGIGTKGDLAALECHESHMVGDCPLCGAE